jgi:hypothetical protein
MRERMGAWQEARDTRRQEFRDQRDQFRGDMRAGVDKLRTDFRNGLNDGIERVGQAFRMPPGFAQKLPWNRGQSGASGMGGTIPEPQPAPAGIAPGEPNPSAPLDPNATPQQRSDHNAARNGWGMNNTHMAAYINNLARRNGGG